MEKTVLSLKNITKIYPGVRALDNVSIDFKEGEVHALLGENGAGKSTLIKVIAGAIQPDGGKIVCFGNEYESLTPHLSRSLGIEVIYQEYNLIDSMSAAENICLGDKFGKLVNYNKMNEVAKELFDLFHIDIEPKTLVKNLTSAQMQIVEIAKSISKNAKILILDEPTAPLTVADVKILMNIIGHLREKGVTIIYISHRLEEIFEIADRATILMDGKYVDTVDVADVNRKQLIQLMVGRELKENYSSRDTSPGEVLFEIKGVSGAKNKDVNISVRAGEIVGLAGLVGAGRTELLRTVYGADKKVGGEVFIDNKPVVIRSPKDAIKHRIGLIPEDRKRHGVVLPQSVKWNISIMSIMALCKGNVVDKKREIQQSKEYCDLLDIKTPGHDTSVASLSGGNQQKVVLAKTLAANSNIIFFDEPTRGIDVGAKQEIYQLMNNLVKEGKAILMVSSDMEELLGMSDRIVVLCKGSVVGELSREEFDQSVILDMASGGWKQ